MLRSCGQLQLLQQGSAFRSIPSSKQPPRSERAAFSAKLDVKRVQLARPSNTSCRAFFLGVKPSRSLPSCAELGGLPQMSGLLEHTGSRLAQRHTSKLAHTTTVRSCDGNERPCGRTRGKSGASGGACPPELHRHTFQRRCPPRTAQRSRLRASSINTSPPTAE